MPRYIKVKVHAGARRPKMEVKAADAFVIDVKEPAENGQANRAVIERLAAHLGISASRFWLVKGARASAKIFEVRDIYE